MDKEAELRTAIHNLIFHSKAKDATELLDQILALIIPKDKPPLLDDGERVNALSKGWNRTFSEHFLETNGRVVETVLEAQREADIKHYEKG